MLQITKYFESYRGSHHISKFGLNSGKSVMLAFVYYRVLEDLHREMQTEPPAKIQHSVNTGKERKKKPQHSAHKAKKKTVRTIYIMTRSLILNTSVSVESKCGAETDAYHNYYNSSESN
jgi:hypothetical protein